MSKRISIGRFTCSVPWRCQCGAVTTINFNRPHRTHMKRLVGRKTIRAVCGECRTQLPPITAPASERVRGA